MSGLFSRRVQQVFGALSIVKKTDPAPVGDAEITFAEQECHRRGWSFPQSFRNQYTITEKHQLGPNDWPSEVCGDWRVSYCGKLPKTHLTLSNGAIVGIVLGYAISPEGMMLEGTVKLPVSGRDINAIAKAEQYIAQLAGRYVVLLSIGQSARVYSDPTCSLGPLYNPAQRRLGASTTLVIDRPVIDNPEIDAESVTSGNARYLFGHTVDRDVKRAMSNHYIDLADFSQHRHWPTADTCFEIGDARWQDLSAAISDKLRLNMKALVDRYSTALPISGATDNRLLLAVASDFLDRIPEKYVQHTNWSNSADLDIARELAEQMSFPLRVISRDSHRFKTHVTPEENDTHLQLRYLRGGNEPDSSDERSIRAMQLVPKGHLILSGSVVEMARGLRWGKAVYDDPHDTKFALSRLSFPQDETAEFYQKTKASFLEWKANLPETAYPRIYDFIHTELWMPHTNSCVFNREAEHFFINPYNDRHLIHLTSRVHPFTRKKHRLVTDMISRHAKEISRIDYTVDRRKRQKSA